MKSPVKSLSVLVLTFCAAFCLSAPVYALPKNHDEFMKNEDYKNAFEQFRSTMEEAEGRLTADEYRTLEKETGEFMELSVEIDMQSGSSETEAWETAFFAGFEQVDKELVWDWLRKNAEGAQGFYRMQSDSFEGYMTLEKGDEEDLYAVTIFLAMKNEPFNSGEFYGPGRLSGGKMSVSYDDVENTLAITFDGDTAIVSSTDEFKSGGALGNRVFLDGRYVREKKQTP